MAAAAAYRDRVVSPYRGVLPDQVVEGIEGQVSGSCTVEISAFDQSTALLAAPGEFDHVVFDTAPTGHTVRMLALQGAWTSFLDTNEVGVTCVGPLSGLTQQRERYRAALQSLADPEQTTLVLVTRPDTGALEEAARAGSELAALGFGNQLLLVNGVHSGPGGAGDRVGRAFVARQRGALELMPPALADLPMESIPLLGRAPMGLEGLSSLLAPERLDSLPTSTLGDVLPDEYELGLARLVEEVSQGGRGLVMTMGKGGVGKTTVARAQDGVVVLDTAPSGHTLLLLDAARSFQREVSRQSTEVPPEVEALLDRLSDPDITRIVVVTLAEPTPVHEAQALQEDLLRAGIRPLAWVVNESLLVTGTGDGLLAALAANERRWMAEAARIGGRVMVVGWQASLPVGPDVLFALVGAAPAAARAGSGGGDGEPSRATDGVKGRRHRLRAGRVPP